MNVIDEYSKKSIIYKHGSLSLQFKVSQELFSSVEIDRGTQRLLRSLIFEEINSYKKVLDLGCGYGPIGLVLKAVCPTAEVHMVDTDALALEFSTSNAKLNHLDSVQVYGSLGYDNVTDTAFDLIVSNIPAKVGEPFLKHLLTEAQQYLTSDGRVVIVVIDAISDFITQELTADENIEILYHNKWPGHHVYHYKFNNLNKKSSISTQSAFEKRLFFREHSSFEFDRFTHQIDTSYNVAEFDQLSFQTKLILDNINYSPKNPHTILCLYPGQGYIPVLMHDIYPSASIHIVDRDLLALKTTQHNLQNIDCSPHIHHQVEFIIEEVKFDFIIGVIPEKQTAAVYQVVLQQIADQLKPGKRALLSSTSTVITRIQEIIAKTKNFDVLARKKSKGSSMLCIARI